MADSIDNTPMPQDKKLLDPENPDINISTRRDARFYIFLSKIILKKFGTVELRSLGLAADSCVRVAENLQRNNYAIIEKIYSETVELQSTRDSKRTSKGARFVICLKKSDQFDQLTETFLKSA